MLFSLAISCEHNGHCPQTCIPGPEGPTCICEPGYENHDNGMTCIDIDECLTENLCSQYCDNIEGSYRCSCAPGYSLEQDHRTCKTINGRPLLIAASSRRIAILPENDAVSTKIEVESSEVIKGIAYHNKLSTLYWVTAEGVSRRNSDGQQALVYKLNNLHPSGLALDTTTGNLYISALLNGSIDGSIVKVISHLLDADTDIITTETKITALAIDGFQGSLFWSEISGPHTGRIIRSTMDGKSTNWLHSIDKIMFPVAIAVDSIKLRIFWADMMLQSILSCDYDGQQQKIVADGTKGQPLSLTFFENRISWSVWHTNFIYNQLNGSQPISAQLLGGSAERLLTSHSVMEPEIPNPCAVSPCSNGLCLLKNNASFTCFCPNGVNVITFSPFRCADTCPRHFFRCPPQLNCLPRSFVCNNDPACDDLSEQDLCANMNNSVAPNFVISNISERLFEDRAMDLNNTYRLPNFEIAPIDVKALGKSGRKVIYSRRIEIRDEVAVQDGQETALPVELSLQAILDGPAHVLSRLFTKKGHFIGMLTLKLYALHTYNYMRAFQYSSYLLLSTNRSCCHVQSRQNTCRYQPRMGRHQSDAFCGRYQSSGRQSLVSIRFLLSYMHLLTDGNIECSGFFGKSFGRKLSLTTEF